MVQSLINGQPPAAYSIKGGRSGVFIQKITNGWLITEHGESYDGTSVSLSASAQDSWANVVHALEESFSLRVPSSQQLTE